MIKGDKIKLIHKMGVFDNIGEICEVVGIEEGGVIYFKFGGCHLGCMSYDEYLKYFEPVEESVVEQKRTWSPWETIMINYFDTNNEQHTRYARIRNNGKKVQVVYRNFETEACCHKDDKFDYDKGRNLAVKRLIVKLLKLEVEKYAESL